MISLINSWSEPSVQRRLATGTSVALGVVLAWLLTRIFWLLAAPADLPASASATPVQARQQTPVERVDLQRYHLFGEYEVNATVAAYHNAPETALNLQLRGIVSGQDSDSGFAIIVASGKQAVYAVGQEVPGGAEVRGIYSDRVVLFHNGRYETLRLPVERPGAPGPQPAAGQLASETEQKTLPMAANLAGWKDRLSLALATDSRYSLIPVSSGGYRLFLGRDAQQMVRTGLRNGDVIRSANGIALNSQADVEQVIAKVLAGETLNLLVLRDGAELSLTPDIEQIISGVR